MSLQLGLASAIETIGRRRFYRDIFEIGLVAIAFLLYFLVRGSVVDREDEALRNAINIIEVEQTLGFFWEPELHEAVLGRDALVHLFNAFYFWLDFPLVVAVGLWMYFFGHRHQYTVARDAVLASGAVALVCYHLFPVMPPRLLPPGSGYAFVDTVNEFSNFSYQAQSAQPFVNPFAAVPSLHYGWQLLVGGVLIWTTSNLLLRGLGVMMPVFQLTAIVFTANHYILDAMAGLLAAILGLLIAMALQRWLYPAVRQRAQRMLRPAPEAMRAVGPG